MAFDERAGVNTADLRTSPVGHGALAPPAQRHEARRRVLLVHSEPAEAASFASALRAVQLESAWVSSGMQALAATRVSQFDLLLVDLELADMSAVSMIKTVRSENTHVRFIVVTGTVTASVTRDALHLGALGVLGKPLQSPDVVAAVRVALRWNIRQPDPPLPKPATDAYHGIPKPVRTAPRSIAERWAMLMLNSIRLEADPKTMSSWAKGLGVSRSVLCECCRLVRVPPHYARDFARLLRVIRRSGSTWEPETLLDVADARTLRKLMAQAGQKDAIGHPPTTSEFLEDQEWIPQNNSGLMALRALLFNDEGGANERQNLI